MYVWNCTRFQRNCQAGPSSNLLTACTFAYTRPVGLTPFIVYLRRNRVCWTGPFSTSSLSWPSQDLMNWPLSSCTFVCSTGPFQRVAYLHPHKIWWTDPVQRVPLPGQSLLNWTLSTSSLPSPWQDLMNWPLSTCTFTWIRSVELASFKAYLFPDKVCWTDSFQGVPSAWQGLWTDPFQHVAYLHPDKVCWTDPFNVYQLPDKVCWTGPV